MKVLYLDLGMGAAGDMLTAALSELLDDKAGFYKELNDIGIPDVSISCEQSIKCGITGAHTIVHVHGVEEDEAPHYHEHEHSHGYHHSHDDEEHHEHNHSHEHHHHSSLEDIRCVIGSLKISDKVKEDAFSVYNLIAGAESHAHGKSVTEIHFHEVGAMDAVTDVVAVCTLMEKLSPDIIVASPVHVGSGHVHCAHGILPVPAPATAYILQGVPTYSDGTDGELCTPTGAALIKYFVKKFDSQPVMTVTRIGYGMGKKDFDRANCIRAMLGESEGGTDIICELSCNVDDMSAEMIAFATERFFEAGAKEVFTQPAYMKKNRLGTLITVLCDENKEDDIIREMFKHTATIGIRESMHKRYILDRSIETIDTEFGSLRKKICKGYGVSKEKYEYDDISRIANEQGKSIEDVIKMLKFD